MKNIEHEITLVVCSKDPGRIIESVANLTTISGYILIQKDNQSITDIYYDTIDNRLKQRKFSLRLRRVKDSWKCAIKGHSRPAKSGGILRKEIELPWSLKNFQKIVSELKVAGINLPNLKPHDQSEDPRNILKDIALKMIQERNTVRMVRNIFNPPDKNGIILAELDIDKTIYQLKKQVIYHYEIEIEEKKSGNSKLLKEICDALITKFNESLIKWEISKLTTGITLERLEKEGLLHNLVFNENYLKLEGYSTIEQLQ